MNWEDSLFSLLAKNHAAATDGPANATRLQPAPAHPQTHTHHHPRPPPPPPPAAHANGPPPQTRQAGSGPVYTPVAPPRPPSHASRPPSVQQQPPRPSPVAATQPQPAPTEPPSAPRKTQPATNYPVVVRDFTFEETSNRIHPVWRFFERQARKDSPHHIARCLQPACGKRWISGLLPGLMSHVFELKCPALSALNDDQLGAVKGVLEDGWATGEIERCVKLHHRLAALVINAGTGGTPMMSSAADTPRSGKRKAPGEIDSVRLFQQSPTQTPPPGTPQLATPRPPFRPPHPMQAESPFANPVPPKGKPGPRPRNSPLVMAFPTPVRDLDRQMLPNEAHEAQHAFSRWVLLANLPFTVLDDENLRTAVRNIRPTFTLPSSADLKATFLPAMLKDVDAAKEKYLRSSKLLTLVADAAAVDPRGDPVVECLAVNELRIACYVAAARSGDQLPRTAEKLALQFRDPVAAWDAPDSYTRLVAVVSDATSTACAALRDEVVAKHRHVLALPCAAGWLNGIVGDILRVDRVSVAVTHALRAIRHLRARGDERLAGLVAPSLPRWLGLFRALRALRDREAVAREVVADLGDNDDDEEEDLVVLVEAGFWEALGLAVEVLKLAASVAMVLEAQHASLADAALAMVLLTTGIKWLARDASRNARHEDLAALQEIEDVVEARWASIPQEHYLAAFLLHPNYRRLADGVELGPVVCEHLRRYHALLHPDGLDARKRLMNELARYVAFQPAMDESDGEPEMLYDSVFHHWELGMPYRELRQLALRLFSVVPTVGGGGGELRWELGSGEAGRGSAGGGQGGTGQPRVVAPSDQVARIVWHDRMQRAVKERLSGRDRPLDMPGLVKSLMPADVLSVFQTGPLPRGPLELREQEEEEEAARKRMRGASGQPVPVGGMQREDEEGVENGETEGGEEDEEFDEDYLEALLGRGSAVVPASEDREPSTLSEIADALVSNPKALSVLLQ
ncbi:hypothetical protein HDU96_001840 [Phlyctochytrium bullatum]|nr:hypothetical protein HDU96_001840 [Phlyctochytrium bullatum]